MNYSKNIQKNIGLLMLFLTINAVTAPAQCNLLCNGDLENGPPSTSWTVVDASQMSCWNTTASDNMIEIWKTGFQSVPAYSGSYFVELNANMVSTLYQDFVATPGTTVNISFAHRGRQGTDVMDVELGPVNGPYTNLGTYSDGSTAWGYYTTSYVIPSGVGVNFSLRFTSVSSAGGATMGNFLDAVSISIPSGTLTVWSKQTSCFGKNDGTAQALVSGGLAPYTYTWLPSSANTSSVTGLAAGIYTVSITEANGCAASHTVQVTEAPAMTATITAQPVSCLGKNDGSATVSVSGSTAPYMYSWIPSGQTTAAANNLSPGTYSALVTSAAGCTVSATAVIKEGSTFSISVSSQSATCAAATGSVSATPGGIGPYSYTWTPGNSYTSTATGLAAGMYSVAITDLVTGCINSSTVAVNSKNTAELSTSYNPANCGEEPNGKAKVSVSGSSGTYTYAWAPAGGNTSEASGLSAGSYTVFVTDADQCLYQKEITVTELMKDDVNIPNVFTPNGDGINDEFRLGNTCKEYRVMIHNRWGQKVFETKDISTNHWAGKNEAGANVPEGVYFYTIVNEERSFTGTVSLFR